MLACSLNPNSKNEPRVAIMAIIQEVLVYQVVFEKINMKMVSELVIRPVQ
jgi:hypothetical protein